MTTTSDDAKPKRKRDRSPDRPMLSSEATARIDCWLTQLAPRLSGRILPRGEIITWLIMGHSDELTEAELTALHAAHYDPVRALKWAVRFAEEASARGEMVNVQEIVSGPNFHQRQRVPRPEKRKKVAKAAGDGEAELPKPPDTLKEETIGS